MARCKVVWRSNGPGMSAVLVQRGHVISAAHFGPSAGRVSKRKRARTKAALLRQCPRR